MNKIIKTIFTAAAVVLIAAFAGTAAGLTYLSVNELSPADVEPVDIGGEPTIEILPGDKIKAMTYNIAYGGMGKGHTDPLDGGSGEEPADIDEIADNLTKIAKLCTDRMAHVNFFQQADINSKRSCMTDEPAILSGGIYGRTNAFAVDHSCVFVPFPIGSSVGEVRSGLLTMTRFGVDSAERRSLPNDYGWPSSTWNRKPCMLVERIDLGDSGRQLVLINTNFEEYDSGEVRAESFKVLCEFMQKEYSNGSYIVAAGGFNAQLPSVQHGKYEDSADDNFTPLELSTELLTGGWKYCTDSSAPTVRRLNAESGAAEYSADGFITSPNTIVEHTETIDTDFRFSNHNPVVCEVTLVN